MQDSADEINSANPDSSDIISPAGVSSDTTSYTSCKTRYVSEVNYTSVPASDADADDKDVVCVDDTWLSADSAVVGSAGDLADGSNHMSLTEPSSSQVGSVVTVISQNHVIGDCFRSQNSIDVAGAMKDDVQNSCDKDKSTDAAALESARKPNDQSACDGDAGRC